jgi:uncharacterized protein (TIGR03067 family)
METAMLLKSFVVLTVALSLSLAGQNGGAKNGDKHEGTWLAQAAELGGQKFPDDVRKAIKLVIKDDKYTVTVGKETDEGTVKLNAAAKPKEMDITGTKGPNKGKTFRNRSPRHFGKNWRSCARDDFVACWHGRTGVTVHAVSSSFGLGLP